MYFFVKCKKNQSKTQGPQGKPKNPRFDRKTKDLGRKPKVWQRCLRVDSVWAIHHYVITHYWIDQDTLYYIRLYL